MRTRWLKRLLSNVFISILLAFGTIGCGLERQHSDYGVFLSVTDDLESLSGFSEVVIDAQFFSKKDIERYADMGADIYLIEYTHDVLLADKVRKYCRQKGFYYYISDSLELD